MKSKVSELSPRQQEIVRLVAAGLEDKQIAAQLGISEGAVGNQLGQVYLKADVGNRIEMLRRFYELVEKT